MEITLSMGDALLKEVAANARFRHVGVEEFLRTAPKALHFARVLMARGQVCLRKGMSHLVFQVNTVAEYRAQRSFRISEDSLADRGGMDVRGLYHLTFDNAQVEPLKEALGAASAQEAAAFAVFQWSRWHNSLREDYPDYELGVLHDHEFYPL